MVTKTGTSNNEDLIGTSTADLLDGSKFGTHRLYGLAGDDQLFGGAGNDVLDGGVGADQMSGGAGDDLYRIDDLGDVITEAADGGTDSVEASIAYILPAFVEKLSLTGAANINGAGNDLANRIKGNDGANVLNGGAGADTISGGGGNDWIIGGAGKDTIDGGLGADTFQLGAADATSTDRILDFAALEDKIAISSSDYGLRLGRGFGSDMTLDPAYFATVSGFSPQGTASHGQFLYNTSSLTLSWDPDGVGILGATPIATFAADAKLQAGMFTILDTIQTNAPPLAPATNSAIAHVNVATAAININATDANNDPLTYAIKADAGPHQGIVTLDQHGSFVYAPNANYQGADDFIITITDGYGGSIDQAVSVSVTPVPAVPHSTPTLAHVTDTRIGFGANIGAVDPAGIVWVPPHGASPGTLFLSDSEVDEAPYNSPNNLFALNLDGSPQGQNFRFDLTNFTKEPTGLAYNPQNGYLYISDDDLYKIFWVDPANPTVKLGEFATKPIGGTDPEDIAINPNNGNIFISNGTPSHLITEVTSDGKPVSQTTVPDVVADMEALAYDANHDVFLVGGGFSAKVWVVNRAGTIVDTIDLSAFRNPSNTHLAVKDIAVAPTSDTHDDPSAMNLYVADYGLTHLPGDNDGRVMEFSLGWNLLA